MRVRFFQQAFYDWYMDEEESDLEEIYKRFCDYFGDEPWILEGNTMDDIEKIVLEIWAPLKGDFIVRRYLNSGLAKVIT